MDSALFPTTARDYRTRCSLRHALLLALAGAALGCADDDGDDAHAERNRSGAAARGQPRSDDASAAGAGNGGLAGDGGAADAHTRPSEAGAAVVPGGDASPTADSGLSPGSAGDGASASVCTIEAGQPDSDGDGKGDSCDDDDDGDGFPDLSDPAPLDRSKPGDFSTPEVILADPKVRAALVAAEQAGYPLTTHTRPTPPALQGFYLRSSGAAKVVAKSEVGGSSPSLGGQESRLVVGSDGALATTAVSFTDGEGVRSVAHTTGELVRGEGASYTIYSRSEMRCQVDGADFRSFDLTIESGRVDALTGDRVDWRHLRVTVGVAGTLTAECADHWSGNTEFVGEWRVATAPRLLKLQPSSLKYFCSDGDDEAHAPGESWLRSGGASCVCGSDLKVSCS